MSGQRMTTSSLKSYSAELIPENYDTSLYLKRLIVDCSCILPRGGIAFIVSTIAHLDPPSA